MNISIGSDHAGFEYKAKLIKLLRKEGHIVEDFGTYSVDSVDYPDFVHPLAQAMKDDTFDVGILLCGSGNGVAMTANKYTYIRAALCWKREIAQLARKHNNANVLAIPARYVSYKMTKDMVNDFITTDFEGGRHERRVNKISDLNNNE